MSADNNIEEVELENLKNKANILGINYHPTIGYGKLLEKVQSHTAEQEKSTSRKPEMTKEEAEDRADKKLRQSTRSKASRMLRVKISCRNPDKRAYKGEIFEVGNTVVEHKRFIPFNKEVNIPTMMVNFIKGKKFVSYTPADPEAKVMQKRIIENEFDVTVLSALSEKDLKDLKRSQYASKRD